LEEALPSLHPGTYEFKFVLDGETWTTNPALPICRNTPYGPGVVVENNFLRIDYRLLNCIERRMPSGTCPQRAEKSKQLSADALDGSCDASSEVLDEDALFDEACERVNAHGRAVSGLPSIGSRRGTVDAWSSNLDESSSDKALEEKMHGVVVAPRRNQSSADRLNTSSLHRNVPFSKKVQSLPDILERAKVSGDLFGICDLLGSSGDNAGTLYDNDVTLLLELPDCKRSVGLSLTAEAWYKPKRGKGEDSYFVSPPVLGVADGVGGLQTALGYTSKAFADELMAKCMAAAKQKLCEDISRDVLPSEFCRKVLCEGFHDMKSYGATTGVVTYFDARSNRLGMAILGDSGVMVVRRPTHKNFDASNKQSMRNTRSYIVFKSPTQQHEFNYPYQLCRLPQELKKLLIKPPDTPEDCVTFDVEVEEGDLILAYSDGVEDNLHDSEVLELCDHCLSPYAAHVLGLPPKAVTPAGLVARALGSAAFLRASDPTAKTPFGEEARKHGWPAAWCRGGKEDDITCVAAWVQHVAETQE
jgi:protein phosphatase PTC7